MQFLHQKRFLFNSDKDSIILSKRKAGFERVVDAIMDGDVLAFMPHSNQQKYPGQYVIHVLIDGEVYVVPCVKENNDTIFLKTVFPSRKIRKLYFSWAFV